MKIGDVYTHERFEEEGWKFITNFGNCQVYGKEYTRIIWSPITKLIRHIFNDCQFV